MNTTLLLLSLLVPMTATIADPAEVITEERNNAPAVKLNREQKRRLMRMGR